MVEEPLQGSGSPFLNGVPRSTIHDLRTPLTSIRGYAQLLLRGVKGEEQARRAYETIFRESERMAAMLDQLAKVTEARLGPSEQGVTRFNLAELTRKQVEAAAARWPEHRLGFRDGEPAEVVADPRRIGELLSILLDNAAGYSTPGTTIEARAQVADGDASVTIADEGIGIPSDEIEAVFECFRRASNAFRAGPNGSRGLGIGLFLARANAEQAGGRVWAESEAERGSVFHLSLPLAN